MKNTEGEGVYKKIGVDIDANDRLTEKYKEIATRARRKEQIGELGAFSGLFDMREQENSVLVASTDGVGTKALIARMSGKLDTIGYDIVNHCVNDILTAGATPLFFLDYLAGSDLSEEEKEKIVASVADACRDNEAALLGGETADMPDVYRAGAFDLAGTIIGSVERENIITGENIKAGDILIAIPSAGLHTNGYSLVRDIFQLREGNKILFEYIPELGEALFEALLRPHRSYLKDIFPILKITKGLAHITGGGISGNLSRVLPSGLGADIYSGSWEVPKIFEFIQKKGGIEYNEMSRVFNMGIGMIVVVEDKNKDEVLRVVDGSREIGKTVSRKGSERIISRQKD